MEAGGGLIGGIQWCIWSAIAGTVYLVYIYFELGGKNRDKS